MKIAVYMDERNQELYQEIKIILNDYNVDLFYNFSHINQDEYEAIIVGPTLYPEVQSKIDEWPILKIIFVREQPTYTPFYTHWIIGAEIDLDTLQKRLNEVISLYFNLDKETKIDLTKEHDHNQCHVIVAINQDEIISRIQEQVKIDLIVNERDQVIYHVKKFKPKYMVLHVRLPGLQDFQSIIEEVLQTDTKLIFLAGDQDPEDKKMMEFAKRGVKIFFDPIPLDKVINEIKENTDKYLPVENHVTNRVLEKLSKKVSLTTKIKEGVQNVWELRSNKGVDDTTKEENKPTREGRERSVQLVSNLFTKLNTEKHKPIIGNVIIGVAGADRGVGCTHFAFQLALFLAEKKLPIAFIELSSTKVMKENFKESHIKETPWGFEFNKFLDIYLKPEEAYSGGYKYIVLDLGVVTEYNAGKLSRGSLFDDFIRSQLPILVGTATSWQIKRMHQITQIGNKNILPVINFAREKDEKEIRNVCHDLFGRITFNPYSPNMFEPMTNHKFWYSILDDLVPK